MATEDEIKEYKDRLDYAKSTNRKVSVRYNEVKELYSGNQPLKREKGNVADIKEEEVCLKVATGYVCIPY